MAKRRPPPSKAQPPSTNRLRRWVDQAFRKPSGLRVESPADETGTMIVSFQVTSANWHALLTQTEADIARDILAGKSNAAIAAKRGTALRTIANQVASIYRKLSVRSRLELSLYALAGRHSFEPKSR